MFGFKMENWLILLLFFHQANKQAISYIIHMAGLGRFIYTVANFNSLAFINSVAHVRPIVLVKFVQQKIFVFFFSFLTASVMCYTTQHGIASKFVFFF